MSGGAGSGSTGFTLAALRGSADCVMLVNLFGRITFVNDSPVCPDLGVPRDQPGSRDLWDLWTPEGADAMRDAMRRAVRGETRSVTVEQERPDGDRRVWTATLTPLLDGAGEVENVLAVIRPAPPPQDG